MRGKILLENISTSREQWLALRSGKVSSSVISVIAGLNSYKSPLQLWAEWTGKVQDNFRGNDLTDLGSFLEPYVGQLYSKRSSKPVRSCDALFAHKDIDWAIASPDFWVGDGEESILETKTGTIRQLQRWADEETPDEYLAQLQWQMGVCGVERGTIAALLGGDPGNLILREFKFDAEVFSTMLELADAFLQHVKKDTPPEAGALDGELLTKLIKRDAGTYVFDEEREPLVSPYFEELCELREQKSALEAEMKKLDVGIKTAENNLKAASCATEMAFRDGRRYRVKRIEVAERVAAAYSYDRVYILNAGRD
jgi:putative phage-type endonuclease